LFFLCLAITHVRLKKQIRKQFDDKKFVNEVSPETAKNVLKER